MSIKRDWSKKTRQKIIVQYYKRAFGKNAETYSEIPEQDRKVLRRIPLQSVVLFVCADDKQTGLSCAQIGNRYDLSEHQVGTYIKTYNKSRFVED